MSGFNTTKECVYCKSMSIDIKSYKDILNAIQLYFRHLASEYFLKLSIDYFANLIYCSPYTSFLPKSFVSFFVKCDHSYGYCFKIRYRNMKPKLKFWHIPACPIHLAMYVEHLTSFQIRTMQVCTFPNVILIGL